MIGAGIAVSESSYTSLLPGNVVGWEWNNDGTIDHVTIYLGNGELAAHATSTLDVPVSYYVGQAFYTHIVNKVATLSTLPLAEISLLAT